MQGESGEGMAIADLGRALAWQADHAEQGGSPVTARVVRGFQALADAGTRCGERMLHWPGLKLEDAMPLRLAGGFHHLHLSGDEPRLAPLYAGTLTDQQAVDALLLAVTRDHDARLAAWLDGPPQTNEAGRSASIMAALLWLSGSLRPRFELLELGASAGVNTMLDRFAFDLGGTKAGPADSPMHIEPVWEGAPPPANPVEIVGIAGCDISPVDLADPVQALRLKSYVWPDAPGRMERIEAAIALAAEKRPDVTQADAADWVEARLALPQASGTTRTLFHSIVWQYIPPNRRERIQAAMDKAGSSATPERPLAWVMLETNRETFRHELKVRHWPGPGIWHLLGEAHPHGAWVKWFGLSPA